MNKISPVSVVAEAFRLLWRRKLAFLGLALLPVLIIAVLVVLVASVLPLDGVGTEGDSEILLKVLILAAYLMGTFALMLLMHYSTTAMRNMPKLLPSPLLKRFRSFLWMGVRICSISFLVTGCYVLPIVIAMWLIGSEGSVIPPLMLMPLVFIAILASLILLLRFSPLVPGVSVGELHSLAQAWRLSKGHGIRMLLSFLLLYLPVIVLFFVYTGVIGIVDVTVASSFTDAYAVLGSLLSFVVSLVHLLTIVVWYEKLRLRHEAV